MKYGRKFRKFAHWLFKGKSLSSHIAFLVFAYVSLKFIIFPVLLSLFGFVDVVAVLSGSMHHRPGSVENTFTGWLIFKGFNESEFNSWPFLNGIDMGDAVTVIKGDIVVGDVIVYYYGNQMIIHRVIGINEIDGVTYYSTKGDANPESLVFEVSIPESVVVGKAGVRVPWVGWPRTLLYYLIGF